MILKELLSQKGLIMQSPKVEEIKDGVKFIDKPIKIFYGETYDEKGNTIDSMKYYFFVDSIARSLKQEGYETDPIIMVADTAACRNVSPNLYKKYMDLGQERVKFIEKIKKIYNLNLRIIKMSDYIGEKKFQEKIKKVENMCKKDPMLMKMVEKTVPESKIELERKKGFAYSFDEITTILDLNIKIGPPRENLYDSIAREIAKREKSKPLISIYLTPTFPLGVDYDFFITHEGIEEHGITAYKAGSKRLQSFRIIIGKTTKIETKKLIEKSFLSTNPKLPNPVLDVGIISEMARKRLEGDDTPITLYDYFYNGKIPPKKFKGSIYNSLCTNILNKLQ